MLASNHKTPYLVVQGTPVPQYILNAHQYHILTEQKVAFECFLIFFEYLQNRNTCYNICILENDFNENMFLVCRNGSRVGTKIGGTIVESFSAKEDAVKCFKKQFFELTGLYWKQRNARRIPGRFLYVYVQRDGMVRFPSNVRAPNKRNTFRLSTSKTWSL